MLDELERVRAYRDEVPEPDDSVVAAARAQLLATIAQAPQPAQRDRHARAGRRAGRLHVQRWRLPFAATRRRRLTLATALATVAAAIAVAVGVGTVTTPPSALAQQMEQLAQVAARQAWTGVPKAGQYMYTASEGTADEGDNGTGSCVIQLTFRREAWIANDGSGATYDSYWGGHFTSAADRASCQASGAHASDFNGRDGGQRYGRGGLAPSLVQTSVSGWRSLSTDPARLLKQIHRLDGGPNTSEELFMNLGDMLRETSAPPAIRAALYRAAALIPGVQLLGPRTDPVHRTGLAVGYYEHGKLWGELIFGQRDAKLLAEEYYTPRGELTDWTAYLQSKVVSKLPHYPLSKY